MKVILYTKNYNKEINEKVNIILSPEFYWIKEIDAPIKTLFEAKKISKNFFKLDLDNYFFDAIKINKKFYAIALKKDIELEIDPKFINNIYLAQELIEFSPIKLDETHILKNVNGIMFILPNVGMDDKLLKLDDVLNNINLKNKINLFSNRVNFSIVLLFFIFILSINFYFIINIYFDNKFENQFKNKESELLKSHSLPITSYQLNSIIKKLEKLNKEQLSFRKKLEFISIHSPRNVLKLSFNNKTFNIEINSSKNLDSIFSKEFKINSRFQNKLYKAELSYE